ncbi:hypothetical protein IGI39_003057 [Enterococcus sp. AZ135]
MEKMDYEVILDGECWTDTWEEICSTAEEFKPLEIREITCIVPRPDKKGVVILAGSKVFTHPQTALGTLQTYSFAHCFPDYTILTSVLKDIGRFGKYKFPWACPLFTLCPMEGGKNSIWINPLEIDTIYTQDGLHYAQLLNGMQLVIPVQRYYALLRAEIACGILAAIRQDTSLFAMYGDRPSDYLVLPRTPFARSLSKRSMLNTFVTRNYEIHRRYQRARFLHYYNDLEEIAQLPHWENWQ